MLVSNAQYEYYLGRDGPAGSSGDRLSQKPSP